jgi:hypothetical protein
VQRLIDDMECVAHDSRHGGCQRRFSSPSALLHHLESGACPSDMIRRKLNLLVQANVATILDTTFYSSVQSTHTPIAKGVD